MNNAIIENIARFLFILLLQVVVLNNIQVSGYFNPFLYLYALLLLPIETPKGLLLVIGFATGLIVDIFTGTLGMHTAASVLLCYLRPNLLKFFAPRDGYEFGTRPVIADLGFVWFISYAGILTFIHHFFLFFVEIFRFSDFFRTFFKVILSSSLTMILILLAQFLTYSERKNRP